MGGNAPAGAGAGGNLDFLRNSPQFQAFRTMVQANPQILQVSIFSLNICIFLYMSTLIRKLVLAADAPRVGEAKSSASETHSRTSGRFSTFDQRAR